MILRRIVTTRSMTANMPQRICVTSNASMSTSSTPSSQKSPSSVSATKKSSEVGAPVVKKRESLRSWFSSITGYLDPADPKDPPIPSDKILFPDAVEQATGVYKLYLLAYENGIVDPHCNLPVERKEGMGTKENPIPIESFLNERIVGCVCEPTQSYLKYMHVYRGEPKRCPCGHWMKLVDAPRFWEKIPREDLLEIPYFRDLEEEGKLDKLLSGELDRELYDDALLEGKHHH